MKTPIIILFILWAVGLLFTANKHGHKRNDKYNIFGTLLAQATELWLLWWAGLFDNL